MYYTTRHGEVLRHMPSVTTPFVITQQENPNKHERSPHWASMERSIIARDRKCMFCGATTHLQAHHIIPFHIDKSMELLAENLITLCMVPGKECHLRIGHNGNWHEYNQTVLRACNLTPDYFKLPF